MKANTRTRPARVPVQGACPSCPVNTSCFGHGADADALQHLDDAVERRFRVAAGEYLYRIGDPFRSLYAIRAGCLKNSIRSENGREQVVGFHMRGDVIGVAGIEPQVYIFDVRALEPSEVCEIPFDRLEELSGTVPALSRNIVRIFGRYRNRDARIQSLRRKSLAQARVAEFVLDFSRRIEARGGDPDNFRLPMSRDDICSYLGLSAGAVSREFTRLGERGIADVSGRVVRLSDANSLRSLADQDG
jgi:CRP/FNR family transcriptional regulator, anaerobic regulatory protein